VFYQELGQVREALPLLQRSLARSQAGDSIVRKLYALIVQCQLPSKEDAWYGTENCVSELWASAASVTTNTYRAGPKFRLPK
jgi:hypothetical protein